jgi:hypothetical protein
MQTFLPFPDFEQSASCLDVKRLNKQILESFQLLELMAYPQRKGWRNHPAFKMWDGYDLALIDYGLAMCLEWTGRGYNEHSLEDKFKNYAMIYPPIGNPKFPKWLGREDFHASHRSNLLRKNPEWYSKFGWTEPSDLPYIWPV